MLQRRVGREVTVDLDYSDVEGDGNGPFCGGVEAPDLSVTSFLVFPTVRTVVISGEEAIWAPHLGGASLEGGLQVTVSGSSDGYRELGKFFLALAELDVGNDTGYHLHIDDLVSEDERTNVDVICRKSRPRSSSTTISLQWTLTRCFAPRERH